MKGNRNSNFKTIGISSKTIGGRDVTEKRFNVKAANIKSWDVIMLQKATTHARLDRAFIELFSSHVFLHIHHCRAIEPNLRLVRRHTMIAAAKFTHHGTHKQTNTPVL